MRGLRVGERLDPRRRRAIALVASGVGYGVPLLDAWLGGRLIGSAPATLYVVAAAYLAGAWLRPPVAVVATVVGAALLTAANQRSGSPYTPGDDVLFYAVLLGSAALAGALITARTAQVRELRRLTTLRTQQRETEVRAAALEERNRVETEVTRAMMQRVGAVVVQASGARLDPDPVALRRLEDAGRAALDDLRAAVGSLRAPEPVEEEVVTPTQSRTAVPPLAPIDLLVGLAGVPLAVESLSTSGSWTSLLGVLVAVPLVWRRRHPLTSVAATYAAALVFGAWVQPLGALASPLVLLSLAAYAVGVQTRGRRLVAGLVLLAGGAGLVAVADRSAAQPGDGLLPGLVWLALAVTAGVVTRRQHERVVRLRVVLEALEAGRGADLRLAAAEQRQAVARDLHDTVAHAMTVVCLHAEAAQRIDDASVPLGVVEQAAREAMTQLRVGLASLEDQDASDGDVWALAAALGVDIRLEPSTGSLGDLRGPVGRVLREALVNAARHAPGVPVTVRVERGPAGVLVEVTNPTAAGGSAYPYGSGSGLVGLAELVEASGGQLEHGPTPGAEFRVVARIPDRLAAPA